MLFGIFEMASKLFAFEVRFSFLQERLAALAEILAVENFESHVYFFGGDPRQ